MIYDTNLIIRYVRNQTMLPIRVVIPIVVAGELEALALKNDWGYQKVKFLQHLIDSYPVADLNREVTRVYAEIDAYSQGKSKQMPLPAGITARNMGKNDLWIAAIALYLDMELHTADGDFDHLVHNGLKLIKHNA
ncbi:PIN domain-containing protein [Fibrella aquatilis]|uniref:PIN domain-containing protein n=1 Tax=Fibrella aquatilis TaxID=2817059 RepID=A0A939G6R2_9BACT|nr:PIN domain-containing protein [Fibrella aquatilis]MBO0932060.1 PIN domain-containing protein [Fibrella aquatilis]